MGDTSAEKRIEIVVECDAQSSGKMRNDIEVRVPGFNETWQLATDEGSMHGGDGTAPPPLALFGAGLAGCLMTQIRAFAKRMGISLRGVKVYAKLRWELRQTGRDPYVAAPLSFGLDVDLDSDAPVEDLKRLLDAAREGCFVEQTLVRANALEHRLKVGEGWIAV